MFIQQIWTRCDDFLCAAVDWFVAQINRVVPFTRSTLRFITGMGFIATVIAMKLLHGPEDFEWVRWCTGAVILLSLTRPSRATTNGMSRSVRLVATIGVPLAFVSMLRHPLFPLLFSGYLAWWVFIYADRAIVPVAATQTT